MTAEVSGARVAVQSCDRFVARTMNWLYDHLRFVRSHRPLVVTNALQNRQEFPELTAWESAPDAFARRVWRKLNGSDVDPFVVRRLRKERPAVLHSHFGYVALGDLDLEKSLGVPWFIGFYGADVYQMGRLAEWRRKYAEVFRRCAKVLALGPVMARHLQELGCPAGKVEVHALGVETSDLPDAPRHWNAAEPLRVLFAGTFREKKGVPYVLQGVAQAIRGGAPVELHLVAEAADKPGDRETEAAALQMVRDLGIEANVIRYKFLEFRELLQLGLKCHVFVAPSVTAADGDSEGTPFVLQQMMATAMPVITTRHSDIPFLFGDALEPLLLDERDAPGIGNRLSEYANSPALLLEHGRLFRERMLSAFDVRDCAARLGRIYDAAS
jgi:colanic acid/amylovoran biosynthesis glycosyltransferase